MKYQVSTISGEQVVEAQKVNILEGFDFIIHRHSNFSALWTVTEVTTGLRIASGNTKKDAVASARDEISRRIAKGKNLQKHIDRQIIKLMNKWLE